VPSASRRAYTLLEIILVLAILVAAAAMAMPALGRSAENQRLSQGADLVRSGLMRAHLQAMREGKLQMFRYQLGGDRFRIETWRALEDETADEQQAGRQRSTTLDAPLPDELEKQLPDGVLFIGGDAQWENRSQQIEQDILAQDARGGEWSRPILFYPDGSTANAHVVVGNRRQASVRIDLRGLTGAVTVQPVERKP
jgi:prepilin-type N-terminal cleavage/methylation domain-containing protein